MLVSIIIPTVGGREDWLERCIDSYETHTSVSTEVIVIRDRPSCGLAWNEGVSLSEGDFIHLTADDIEAHPGWFEAGHKSLQRSELPAARILNGDGSLQSCGDEHDRPDGFVTEIPRIPLLPFWLAKEIFPIRHLHYYSDNIVGDLARSLGWETVVNREYLFTHHLASAGRLDERLMSDYHRYRNGS